LLKHYKNELLIRLNIRVLSLNGSFQQSQPDEKNPKSSYALFNLGIMYYRIEDLESALSCFQKAIQTEEANSDPKQKMIEMYKAAFHDVEKEAKKKRKK